MQALLQDPRLLHGAGAVELQLSKQLKAFATETALVTGSLDQYAIRKFADAFDVIPRTLAENSGQDPSTVMLRPLPAGAGSIMRLYCAGVALVL